ncbi:MAG: ferredoxin family protein [Planctomycetota bacterium]
MTVTGKPASRPGPSAPLTELRVHLDAGADAALGADERAALLAALLGAGHAVTRGPAPEGTVLATLGSDVQVADRPPEDVVADVAARREAAATAAPGAWTPWFPVIDYDRCTNCMQCLSFCLFDVYSVDGNGRITVQNQEKCKTSCPACSRVCPEVAILFPKYKKGPINGDVVREEDITSESMKVDISSLLGGDIYSALKDRSQTAKDRFSTERDESKALLERKRCLKELKDKLDIPSEVLMSLPSAGDIEERAERARAKQAERLARSQSVQDQQRSSGATEKEWDI